jgi:hypothetical protein
VGHAATLVEERKVLLTRTEFLVREFHPDVPAGAVIRAVIRCRAELLHSGVRRGLARTTEARVRAQLVRERSPGAGGSQVSAGSGDPGQSSSRAPRTAACSANRWSGRETL